MQIYNTGLVNKMIYLCVTFSRDNNFTTEKGKSEIVKI